MLVLLRAVQTLISGNTKGVKLKLVTSYRSPASVTGFTSICNDLAWLKTRLPLGLDHTMLGSAHR